MSLYSPDTGAIPRGTAFVSLLSQRDLSLQVPINYVTLPGVSLTAACFPDHRYEDVSSKCFSNLLSTGFRRLSLDVYWDSSRRLWSLCPVQLGDASPSSETTSVAESSSAPTSSATLASGQLTDREDVRMRQASVSSSRTTSGDSNITSVSLTSAAASSTGTIITSNSGTSGSTGASAPSPSSLNNVLIEAGNFSCTTTTNLDQFTSVLSAYLQNTETDLNATTRYVILNLHAAAPASDPAGSPMEPSADEMPRESTLLSSILKSNNSAFLFTPTELAEERGELNGTGNWFGGRSNLQPDPAYFTITERTIGNSGLATLDGWPSEGFLELQRAKRLVVGFGEIQPQMAAYNLSGDAPFIFPPGYLQKNSPQLTIKGGEVTSGCFFKPGEETVSSSTNSSWSVAVIDDATQESDVLTLVQNLTSCGISPFLNRTLNNTDAATDYKPYQAFANAAKWAWADGEPRNNSVSNGEGVEYSCAALNATVARWQAVDCAGTHYAACRVGDTPYRWAISSQQGHYANVDEGCPDNSTFAVPRTALENTYLIAAWRQHLSAHSDLRDDMLWLDFNDIGTDACWVIGQNGTCPYLPSQSSVKGREIIVPTVAAVLVFVLAALTMFIKCAANRQKSRSKKRRGDNGWDYEGVPS
ncbi:Maintenance of telomere capping protein 6 [Elasticomyces elasticus]|nr:Maintenance of telomere capping protein 6 [Elasticomyces elasticus]KAK3655237.1 Maintenance of telomere capping protein 6 [Elasticomyces elasticus]KAK4913516.1 Maintenance of telomere capping protein 6 [Elasticomyces elasticus]KAK5767283.1 Maintenance of telomere capping protein 6 [Elasticomyces elasticus]